MHIEPLYAENGISKYQNAFNLGFSEFRLPRVDLRLFAWKELEGSYQGHPFTFHRKCCPR
jgi:hypothetical protein